MPEHIAVLGEAQGGWPQPNYLGRGAAKKKRGVRGGRDGRGVT